MKRGLLLASLVFVIFSLSGVFAAACDLSVSLINQDPYPATPGEYIKLVFQIDGVENPECGQVEFELLEKYPIVFDPDENPKVIVDSGTFKKDYSSFLLAPYKVRIDENALDGSNPVEVQYRFGTNLDYETTQFDLEVEDARADFEVHVKNYDSATRVITFEILNIAKADIEALSIEVPKQENIEVKGAKVNIVGDLDSNEYTTADFEVLPKDGELKLLISYSDSNNERRTVEKNVVYESEYFEGLVSQEKESKTGTYIFWGVIVLIVVYYFWRRHKKKKAFREKLKKK